MPDVKKPPLDIGECEGEDLIKISTSKLKTWRICHKKAEYKYVQKLAKKAKGVQLYRGSIIHECLESYYLTGKYGEVIQKYKKEIADLFPEEQVLYNGLMDEIKRIMRGYVYTWKKNDSAWRIIATELHVRIRIPGTNIVMVVILDMIIEDPEGIWIVDHKTHKNLPNEENRMFDIQSNNYIWAINDILKAIGEDPDKFRGFVFNYIRTKAPTIPQILQSGGLSKRKIDTDRATIIATCKENGLDYHDYMDMIQAADGREYFDRQRITKSKTVITNTLRDAVATGSLIPHIKYFARNTGMWCTWGCEFKDLCLAEMYGHDSTFLRQADFTIKKEESEYGEEEESRRTGS